MRKRIGDQPAAASVLRRYQGMPPMRVSNFDRDSAEKIERRNMLRKQICVSAGAVAYDPNKSMLGATTQQLLEDRRRCLKAAQSILDKVKREKRADMDENETEIWNEAMEVADRISEELDNRRAAGTFEDTDSPLNRIFPGDPAVGARAGRSRAGVAAPEMWRTADGKMVPALGREHRMADYCPEANPPRDPDQRRLSFGSLVRAMVIPEARGEHEIRALAEGTDSAGGFTVPTPLSTQIIDLMRAKTRVVQAGATTIPMSSETLSIARVATDPTLAWKAEAAESTPTDMTFERVLFTSHTLRCVVLASQELLQDSVNVEQALMDAFAGTFAVQLDRVALRGTGLNDEPAGILNQSGVLTIDNNGSAISSYGLILDAIEDMLEQNSSMPTAAIMAPRSLIKFNKLTDTTGQPLMRPPMIQNLPFLDTTSVPTDDTQGSPANLTKLYVGDFTKLMIGLRLRLSVQVLRERYADSYEYGFLAAMRADVQLRHPKSFNVITEVL
jgi:HK97 family phage major capsid protein